MYLSAGYNQHTMNGSPKTNLSDLYSDRKHTIVPNTVDEQTESDRSFDTSPFVVSLSVIAVLVVGLFLMAYAGYRVGTSQSKVVAATAMAREVAVQYDLASKNIDQGQYKMALERLEFVVNVAPDYSKAADLLYQTRAQLSTTAIPIIESTKAVVARQDLMTSEERLDIISMAYSNQEWQNVISNVDMLKASGTTYDSDVVDGILFVALRNRGIQRIEVGDLELGLADLEHAEQITALDEVANQRRRWASLYQSASTFWDINWIIVIDNLNILHQIAPNFRDTSSKLWAARTLYGETLLREENYCLAEEQFAFALDMKPERSLDDKLIESVTNCDNEESESIE